MVTFALGREIVVQLVESRMSNGRKHPVLTATRLTRSQRATVDFAAKLEGVTVTELLREAALRVAREKVEQHISRDGS